MTSGNHNPSAPTAVPQPGGSAADAPPPACAVHVPCDRCGYDLFLLGRDDYCPECNLPVAASLNPARLLFTRTPCLYRLEVYLWLWLALLSGSLLVGWLEDPQSPSFVLVLAMDVLRVLWPFQAVLLLLVIAECCRTRPERVFGWILALAAAAEGTFYAYNMLVLSKAPSSNIYVVVGAGVFAGCYLLLALLCGRMRRWRSAALCYAASATVVAWCFTLDVLHCLRQSQLPGVVQSALFRLFLWGPDLIAAAGVLLVALAVHRVRQQRRRLVSPARQTTLSASVS